MTHGSLFSGIGGFDLAAEWAGWTNVFQVEWNEYCQKILKKNFPDARIYGDIQEFDGTAWRGSVDIISGGFPCQPYSSAGKRLGKEDERHLWPEMLRVIREAAPRWVVGENVRGLVNWSKGLVFEEVCADLEAAGYEVQPFLLPAASVNAPHRRDRIWFVAYRSCEQVGIDGQSREHGGLGRTVAHAKVSNDQGDERGIPEKNGGQEFNNVSASGKPGLGFCKKGLDTHPQGQQVRPGLCESEQGGQRRGRSGDVGGKVTPDAKFFRSVQGHGENTSKQFNEDGEKRNAANTNHQRREKQHTAGEPGRPGRPSGGVLTQWDEWTTESPVCRVDDGIPRRMDRIAASETP